LGIYARRVFMTHAEGGELEETVILTFGDFVIVLGAVIHPHADQQVIFGIRLEDLVAFLDFWTSAEAANILAKNGYA
ncbi:hypothetical protein AB9F39_36125, partial [Rhizobium leguminosarum]|uniref:hypothetical protein n=1 Tax=Rhizobium leguminosarum TaxID=384 RepID=UPI003F96AA07